MLRSFRMINMCKFSSIIVIKNPSPSFNFLSQEIKMGKLFISTYFRRKMSTDQLSESLLQMKHDVFDVDKTIEKSNQKLLREYYNFSSDELSHIENSNKHILKDYLSMNHTLKICKDSNIDKLVLMEHVEILFMRPDDLIEKLNLLSKVKFHNINHAVPFIKIHDKTLSLLSAHLKNEESKIPQGNLLYYLSERLKVDPYILSKFVSKRLFIFRIPFDNLEKTCNVLLDMGVQSENLMRDLWVFKYNADTIFRRLDKAKKTGKSNLMPWMVRCPEKTLERSIHLTTVSKELLGDNESIVTYLASKLTCTIDEVNNMIYKIPAIRTMRVSKAKNILDYIHLQGFGNKDIINTPRILAHSLITTKKRFEELEALGFRINNLAVVCKSIKDYEKFLKSKK